MIPAIDNLPDISFIDGMTLSDVEQRMVETYETAYAEETGDEISLETGDPMKLLIRACAVLAYQELIYIDRGAKMSLLKYSYGDFLDNLVSNKGIEREGAKAASVVERFTLSTARPDAIGIPAGTQVTDGDVYFETAAYAEIQAGETSIDITCTCMDPGEGGNDLEPGTIDILVNPIPYVASVTNVNTSSGGVDIEDDDTLRERFYLAPSTYSVAGPDDAYKYWAMTYNSEIADVYVDSDSPVEVVVKVMMDGGVLPSDNVLSGLAEYLSDEKIRPLTDKVTVKAPATVNYSLNMRYFINRSDTGAASTIQSQVNEAVSEYITWQSAKIGRDINPSELVSLVMAAGAKRVEVTSPVFQVVGKGNVASLSAKTVTYGGIEDD